jgi:hypothetical protein
MADKNIVIEAVTELGDAVAETGIQLLESFLPDRK